LPDKSLEKKVVFKLAREFGTGEDSSAYGIAFSHNGRYLAYAFDAHEFTPNEIETVYIWDILESRMVRQFSRSSSGGGDESTFLEFSPDDAYVACAHGASADVWEVATGRKLRSFYRAQGSMSSVHFQPDGELLATIQVRSPVNLWDWRSGKLSRSIEGSDSGVFSPDGKYFAVASYSWNTIHIFSAHNWDRLQIIPSDSGVQSLSFSRDSTLLGCSADAGFTLWDARTGSIVRKIPKHDIVPPHGKLVYFSTCVLSPEGRWLAIGFSSFDRPRNPDEPILITVDITSGKTLQVLQETGKDDNTQAVAISPDSLYIASAQSKKVYLWQRNPLP
jgi:WD40 repeat protein